jgi:hypothetical protein
LPNLITADVSGNMLDFASLEINASLTGLNYGNQAALGAFSELEIPVGTNHTVFVNSGGSADQFQWMLNGTIVGGATQSSYEIVAISRNNMGDYTCEVTNPNVPGLVLTSETQRVLAIANLTGRLLINPTDPATVGAMSLFRITTSGGYDTTAVKGINPDGTYLIDKVVLDDYQLLGFADTLTHEGAIPTYFEKTIFWEEADTLIVENNIDNLDIVSEFKPEPPKDGVGEIYGVFSEEIPDEGRILKNQRVKKAGASVRRVERTARGKDVILTLIAYTFTNDNGEFLFTKLDPGEYRLNLQYPGYPMDTTSFIDITVGTGLFDKQVAVDALVIDGKIVVTKRIITGWEEANSPYLVFPNPAKNVIRLKSKLGPSNGVRINFTETNGRSITIPLSYDQNEDEWRMDVSGVSFGLYFIKVIENGEFHTLKVVIEK